MTKPISEDEKYLLARGWIWAKDPFHGESWQKGNHVAATAGGAVEYERTVLQRFPRNPTPRGWTVQPNR
jgi:hypothetical protein